MMTADNGEKKYFFLLPTLSMWDKQYGKKSMVVVTESKSVNIIQSNIEYKASIKLLDRSMTKI